MATSILARPQATDDTLRTVATLTLFCCECPLYFSWSNRCPDIFDELIRVAKVYQEQSRFTNGEYFDPSVALRKLAEIVIASERLGDDELRAAVETVIQEACDEEDDLEEVDYGIPASADIAATHHKFESKIVLVDDLLCQKIIRQGQGGAGIRAAFRHGDIRRLSEYAPFLFFNALLYRGAPF